MTHPVLRRSIAATVVLTAALGSLALAQPVLAQPALAQQALGDAAASGAVSDVKDASCVAGDSRELCAPIGELLEVRIGYVHPTQPSLGYDEVYYKLGRYSSQLSKDAINKKFDDWCEADGRGGAATAGAASTLRDPASFDCTIPVGSETADSIAPMKTVVIGPGGTLYLTDGHHTLTSFAEDAQGGLDTHVRLRVLGNLSGLTTSAFWDTMKANKWAWLRDVDGRSITPAQLPPSVGLANFQDDRYRSILYFARDIGYSSDGAVPFQEFYWGSWLRSAAGIASTGIDLTGWDQDDWASSLALVKRLTLAQAGLEPGFVVDADSGYTAAQLSAFTGKWNAGKAENKGEFAKLAAPYSSAKPGKLAYMTAYRALLAPTKPTEPTEPTEPTTPTPTPNPTDSGVTDPGTTGSGTSASGTAGSTRSTTSAGALAATGSSRPILVYAAAAIAAILAGAIVMLVRRTVSAR